MTRRPQDFDSLGDQSSIWRAQAESLPGCNGSLRLAELVLSFDNGLLDLNIVAEDCECGDKPCATDVSAGLFDFLTVEQVQSLAEQLNAWLNWKRGCEHSKFARTNRCGEMSCWNYASRHNS